MSSAADQLAHGALSEQALAWLQRVQAEDATGDDWSALTDWLEASPAHLAAFEAAERLTAEIDTGRIASLYVNSYNTVARAAYSRVGFVEVGTFATVLLD